MYTGLPPVSAQRHMPGLVAAETGGFEGLRHLVAKVRCGRSQASCGEEGMSSEELQQFVWEEFFTDPTHWWDNRRSKLTPRHPDFRHKKLKVARWLDSQHKPAWSDWQLATWYTGPPESVSPSPQRQGGHLAEAVDALNRLVQRQCRVLTSLFYVLLKRCIAHKNLDLGRRVHALAVESGYEGDAFLATHLIGLYATHGRLGEAMEVFSRVTTPSSYNWASIIFACANYGEPTQAVGLYRQMLQSTGKPPDNRIYVAALKACASAGDLAAGKDVHAHILASAGKPDMFVENSLLHMYAKCGSSEDARRVFDGLSQKDVVTWNAMIAGYAQEGMGEGALSLYSIMQQNGVSPVSVTFVSLLQACASLGVGALDQGKRIHEQAEERGLQHDVVVANSLINMYAKCGSLEDAFRVFERLSRKDVVTWNAMIAGYGQQGMEQQALCLYTSMQQEGTTPPDSFTFTCLLQACASMGVAALEQGKQLHAEIGEQGLESDVAVGNSLVNMYGKCGSLEDAQRVFDRLAQKTVVTWTAMIASYAQQGMGQEALRLYRSMQQEGITPPNSVTFVCLLQACASLAALPLGKQLHAQIEERQLQADVVVGNSLVSMYAKCGSMMDSQQVFDSLPQRDAVTWNAIIAGYARQGDSLVVFDLVDRMRQDSVQPNSITFLSVLTVCSHVGLVEKGQKYFKAMSTVYGVTPTIGHYTCMIDLLGRAGHLDQALQMAYSMPFQANASVWLTLLGACRKWGNVEVGRQAFESAVRLDEKNAPPYVLMSNIYKGAHMWDDAEEIQNRRLKCGALKEPGRSWWTDMGGVIHDFTVGRKHPESNARLEPQVWEMKKAAYS